MMPLQRENLLEFGALNRLPLLGTEASTKRSRFIVRYETTLAPTPSSVEEETTIPNSW